MRAVVRGVLAAVVGLLSAAVASAQPDARQMSGIPLPGPELPDGTVSVRVVRGTMTNNVAGQAVTLRTGGIVREGTTDDHGRAQFTGIAPGTTVSAQARVADETLESQAFPMPARGGVRLALVAGAGVGTGAATAPADAAAVPAQPGTVQLGGDSRIIFEFQDDNLAVFYLLDLVNASTAPVAVDGPLLLDLPAGAAGAALMEGASRQASLRGTRLIVTGPFQPGTTSVSLAFTLPVDGAEQALTQVFPADITRLLVAGEKVGSFGFRSPQLGAAQEASSNGTPFLMATTGSLARGQALQLTLTGLPHRSRTWRYGAVVLGVVVLVAGLWAGISARPGAHAASRSALESRRERCFAELTALEADHRRGRVDARRFGDRRASLIAELERLYGELEAHDEGRAA